MDASLNRITKGVFQQNDINFQPEGTIWDSHNGRFLHLSDGNYAWENIEGTKKVFIDFGDYNPEYIIGFDYIGREAIFSNLEYDNKPKFLLVGKNYDQIGIVILDGINEDNVIYKRIWPTNPGNNYLLNLNVEYPITKVQYYIENDKTFRVYFNDKLNQPRTINIRKSQSDIAAMSYDELNLCQKSAPYMTANLQLDASNGNLQPGTYYYTFRYHIKEDGFTSPWSILIGPIQVNNATNIGGTYPEYAQVGGDDSNNFTNRSVTTSCYMIGTSGKNKIVEIVSFKAADYLSLYPGTIVKIEETTSESIDYIHKDTYGSNYGNVGIADIINSNVSIERCNDMQIIKNMLVVAAKTDNSIDWDTISVCDSNVWKDSNTYFELNDLYFPFDTFFGTGTNVNDNKKYYPPSVPSGQNYPDLYSNFKAPYFGNLKWNGMPWDKLPYYYDTMHKYYDTNKQKWFLVKFNQPIDNSNTALKIQDADIIFDTNYRKWYIDKNLNNTSNNVQSFEPVLALKKYERWYYNGQYTNPYDIGDLTTKSEYDITSLYYDYPDYKGNILSSKAKSMWRGKTYSIGVVLFDNNLKALGVKFIQDFTAPDLNTAPLIGQNVSKGNPFMRLLGLKLSQLDLSEFMYWENGARKCKLSGFSFVVSINDNGIKSEGIVLSSLTPNNKYFGLHGNSAISLYHNGVYGSLRLPNLSNEALNESTVKYTHLLSPETLFNYQAGIYNPQEDDEIRWEVTLNGIRNELTPEAIISGYSNDELGGLWPISNWSTTNAEAAYRACFQQCGLSDRGFYTHFVQKFYQKIPTEDKPTKTSYTIKKSIRINLLQETPINDSYSINYRAGFYAFGRDRWTHLHSGHILEFEEDFLMQEFKHNTNDSYKDFPIVNYVSIRNKNRNNLSGNSNKIYNFFGHYQPITSEVIQNICAPGQLNLIFKGTEIMPGEAYITPLMVSTFLSSQNTSTVNSYYGQSIIFACQSRINTLQRHDDTVEKLGIYNGNNSGIGLTDPDVGANYIKTEKFMYNESFGNKETGFYGIQLPVTAVFQNRFPFQIAWSDVKSNGQLTDSFRIFRPLNYRDVDGEYGEIMALAKHSEYLLYFQENAYGYSPCNERALLQTEQGLTALLGTSGTFPMHSKLADYGIQNNFSLCESEQAFYFIDRYKKAFIQIIKSAIGQGRNISLLGIQPILENNLDTSMTDSMLSYKYINTVYDEARKEIWFHFHNGNSGYNKVWIYNELSNSFVGTFDGTNVSPFVTPFGKRLIMAPIILTNAKYLHEFYDPDAKRQNIVNSYQDSYITLVSNKNPELSKVFDNLILKGNNQPFDYVDYDNGDQQITETITNSNLISKYWKYILGKWYSSIPRLSKKRIRNSGYLKMTFRVDAQNNKIVRLIELITKFRQEY